jgi:hypothetical protein
MGPTTQSPCAALGREASRAAWRPSKRGYECPCRLEDGGPFAGCAYLLKIAPVAVVLVAPGMDQPRYGTRSVRFWKGSRCGRSRTNFAVGALKHHLRGTNGGKRLGAFQEPGEEPENGAAG